MSEERGPGGVVSQVVGIRCEEYPDECQFAMQAGVFDRAAGVDLFPSMRARETCPSCGGGVENWEPEFASSAPGRPAEW